MPVSTDDFVSVSDFLGRYCWLVDAGDAESWAALWAEDGVFTGVGPEPIVGREALMAIPRGVKTRSGGKLRHLIGNLHCDYADGARDRIVARYYNLVTTWGSGGALAGMALSTVRLARAAGGWSILRNDTVYLA